MGCDEIRDKLDDYDVGTLSSADNRRVALHLEQCAACQAVWQQHRALKRELAALPVPPRPVGLLDAASIRGRSPTHPHRRLTAWAVAATLLVGVAAGWFGARQMGADTSPAVQQVTLQAGMVSTVSLAFQSRTAMEDVQFTLHVPPGFVLQGHPGEHELRWKGQLAQGKNLLRLPFTAAPGAHGTLRATLKAEGRERSYEVKLDATPAGGRSVRQSLEKNVWAERRDVSALHEVAYA